MKNIKDYTEKYTQHYQEDFSFEREIVRSRRQKVLASLKRYPHKSILEIGCGLEPIFPYCKDNIRVTVVEPSPTFFQNVEKLAQKKPLITVIHDYFEKVYTSLEKSEKFDFIILSGLLHEVHNPLELLQAIRAVCRDDTVVHINVPNVRSLHRILALEMGIIKSLFDKSETDKELQRHHGFDKETLFGILRKNGFQILAFGTYLIKYFSNKQLESIVKHRIVDKSLFSGMEKMIDYMPEYGCEMFVEVKKSYKP